ncbi:MAG: tRNA pseudouridine(38-40) synthase TruA [Lachnospiraceae bacterium]|nr:tRNA pseudouridine(38-40) synthase TruA [Lachnospiraceae bacterium]
MTNYRMLVQYDGSRYNGWQKQGDTKNTIQEKLETILSRMTGSPVDIHGAGRTDAGVHAEGQVAQFRLDRELPPEEIRSYLNEYLPEDIGILEVAAAGPRFHSRYNAARKTYLYRIALDKSRHVFDRKYVYEYSGVLDLAAMRQAASLLAGEHDFMSFCGNPRMKKSTVRRLFEVNISRVSDEIRLEFIGEGFLQYMVRILVGTLIEVGEGKRDPDSMPSLLAARDRKLAGPTAPPQGLTLKEVRYH